MLFHVVEGEKYVMWVLHYELLAMRKIWKAKQFVTVHLGLAGILNMTLRKSIPISCIERIAAKILELLVD